MALRVWVAKMVIASARKMTAKSARSAGFGGCAHNNMAHARQPIGIRVSAKTP